MNQPRERPASGGSYPPFFEGIPERQLELGRFRVRFARGEEELDTIFRLRFEVFNLELGEGLDASLSTRRDEDHFDRQCHHLLVEDQRSGAIVGTYRLQTFEMAQAGQGFYSSGEYDLTRLPRPILEQSIEIGRACIRREHRNRQVLFLLWRGLALYILRNRKRYYFGCCSLTSQCPVEGLKLYRQLNESGKVLSDIYVPALPDIRCHATEEEIARQADIHLPTLFRTYLRYGVLVCSEPAIDSAFKTIDYLVLLDIEQISHKTRRLFFGGLER